MLGIDVLEADGFTAIKGKRIGLLTHPAGVNRSGELTSEVLRRAPGTKLVALFAPEHGLAGTENASVEFGDTVDPRSGVTIYSLHGKNRRPTQAQLANLDALVIDLQDIGVRSYTFNVVMHHAMESCFLHGVEVIVLDRPNPLGGLKVSGPILDREWTSGVGAFPVPYVHGLTMGELARLAADTPGILKVPDSLRLLGKLTVIPMRGWSRAMRWPETGLSFVPTSPYIRDFDAIVGYAMAGLGCESSGFAHGLGTSYPFRCLWFKGIPASRLELDLRALKLEGLQFRTVPVSLLKGNATPRVVVEVQDWEKWDPTELSFHLMRLACRYNPPNPFAKLDTTKADLFNKHVGSTAWWHTLRREGANVDVGKWIQDWRTAATAYHQNTRKYWLYDER